MASTNNQQPKAVTPTLNFNSLSGGAGHIPNLQYATSSGGGHRAAENVKAGIVGTSLNSQQLVSITQGKSGSGSGNNGYSSNQGTGNVAQSYHQIYAQSQH